MKILYKHIGVYSYQFWFAFVLLLITFTKAHAELHIETTTQDVAAIARAIGGQHVEVHSLTPGTRDPHFAVAKPSMIRRVFRADLLLLIGAEMEIGWLPPLLQSARNSKVQLGNSGYLDLSQSVSLLGKTNGPVSRAAGDVHATGNPHYWLDPSNGIHMAKAITERLTQLDPENTKAYQANYKSFEKALNTKITQWRKTLSELKGKQVIAYHNSFIYLANAFGFKIVDEVEPKPGIAPSVASLSNLVTRIKNENIGLLIMEPYYESRSAKYLMQHTDIKLFVLPQSVGARVKEGQPEIKNYLDLFDAIVKTFKQKGEK